MKNSDARQTLGDGGKIVARGEKVWERKTEENEENTRKKRRERMRKGEKKKESDFPWYSNRLDTWNWPEKGKYYMSKKERIRRWVKIEKVKVTVN